MSASISGLLNNNRWGGGASPLRPSNGRRNRSKLRIVLNLRRQFAFAERKGHLRALVLILPLLVFVLVTFAVPVVLLLTRAVYDPSIATTLPRTVAALEDWDGKATPDEPAFAALVEDFRKVSENNTAAFVGKRLNYEISGVRSKVIASAAKAAALDRAAIQGADDRGRQDVGRPADLDEDQAVGKAADRLLRAEGARSCSIRSRAISRLCRSPRRCTSPSFSGRSTSARWSPSSRCFSAIPSLSCWLMPRSE